MIASLKSVSLPLVAAGLLGTSALDLRAETWAGRQIFDRNHADIAARYDSDEDRWEMFLDRGDFDSAGNEFSLDSIWIKIDPAIIDFVWDEDDLLRFIGEPGTRFVVVPSSSNSGVIHLGTNSYDVPAGIFENVPFERTDGTTADFFNNGRVDFILEDVRGPGEYFGYTANSNNNTTRIYFNSRWLNDEDFPNLFPEEAGGHSHVDTVFTEPGLYEVVKRNAGKLIETGEYREGDLFKIPYVVVPQAFHWWLLQHLDFATAVDVQGAMNQPAPGQSIPLLVAYAFGLDPLAPDLSRLPRPEMVSYEGNPHLSLVARFPEGTEDRDDRSDLTYQLQWSEDLEVWHDVPEEDIAWEDLADAPDGTPVKRAVLLSRDPGEEKRTFLRFQIELTLEPLPEPSF